MAEGPAGTPEPLTGAGALPGEDGVLRCPWAATGPPDYRAYHDEEWGRPVRGEAELFERVSLEAFQSGLAWLTILRKRDAFRRAFAGFDPEVVAAFGPDDEQRLLADAGIVRNRAKVAATVRNARAVLDLRDAVDGGLPALVWSYAPDPRPERPATVADVPVDTPASRSMAKDLGGHGFAFVGPRTAYALMQACGLVDDHVRDCEAPPAVPGR